MFEQFQLRLKQGGYKLTRPRQLVFEYLQTHHPTEISALIKSLCRGVDRASLYRTLGLFRNLEIIQDVVVARNKMIELTDSFDSHHHHLSCLKCGSTKTFEDGVIESRLNNVAANAGFIKIEHQFEISGVCPNCRPKASI